VGGGEAALGGREGFLEVKENREKETYSKIILEKGTLKGREREELGENYTGMVKGLE